MRFTLCALLLGFLLDLLLGDPHWLYHPIQAVKSDRFFGKDPALPVS